MNIYFEALNASGFAQGLAMFMHTYNGVGAGDKNAIQKFMGKNDHKVWGRLTMVFVHQGKINSSLSMDKYSSPTIMTNNDQLKDESPIQGKGYQHVVGCSQRKGLQKLKKMGKRHIWYIRLFSFI